MNIVWKRPDGGVSVTVLARKAIARMQWAQANVGLVAKKDELLAAHAELEQQTAELRQQIAAADANEPTLADVQDAALEKAAAGQTVARQLAAIAQVEEVRDTIGLDEHAHELILIANAQAHLEATGQRPEVLDFICVGHSLEVPTDRTYRDAWIFDGAQIVHEMDRARAVHKDLMRAARALKFPALDVQAMRALEQGNVGLAEVAKRKQELRDVTADPAIAKASTIDELRAVWPDCLK